MIYYIDNILKQSLYKDKILDQMFVIHNNYDYNDNKVQHISDIIYNVKERNNHSFYSCNSSLIINPNCVNDYTGNQRSALNCFVLYTFLYYCEQYK
jgi:hypothetical protein